MAPCKVMMAAVAVAMVMVMATLMVISIWSRGPERCPWQVTMRCHHRYRSAELHTAHGQGCGMLINDHAPDHHLHVRQHAGRVVGLWAERW